MLVTVPVGRAALLTADTIGLVLAASPATESTRWIRLLVKTGFEIKKDPGPDPEPR
jgi:hypothetical protein